jgi:opine dehydrogenase
MSDKQCLSITVCGSGNAGLSIAADCAMKGFRVTLYELESQAAHLTPFLSTGGVEITQDSKTTSGLTGFAKLSCVTTNPGDAVSGADVIMITVPGMYHQIFVETLLPHLKAGQVLLFNTAFWGALRHAKMVNAKAPGVILAESSIMPYAAQRTADNRVHISGVKRSFALSAFPGKLTADVHNLLSRIYQQYEPVDTVLDVNVAHAAAPGITLPIILPMAGLYFDRYRGGKLYADATEPGARLIYAYEEERAVLSRHLGGTQPLSFVEWQNRSYGYAVDEVDKLMRKSDLLDWYATSEYVEQLIDEYTIYCWIPMVQLAAAAGIDMHVTRSMITVMGTILGKNYWELGSASVQLGLKDLTADQIRALFITGFQG